MKLKFSISHGAICGIIYFLYCFGSFATTFWNVNANLVRIPMWLFVVVSILYGFRCGKVINSAFLKWYLPFLGVCALSLLYTKNFELSSSMLFDVFTAFLFGLSFTSLLGYEKGYAWIKYSNIILSILFGVSLLANFTQTVWWSRLGDEFGFNANLLSLMFILPLCFSIIEFVNKRKVLLNAVSICVCAAVILLTGSKKGILCAFVFLVVFLFLRVENPTKKIKIFFVISIVAIFVFYLVMNNSVLYNIIGCRIEDMLYTLFNNKLNSVGSTSMSTMERTDMVNKGFQYFLQRPVLGNGLNSFRYMYGLETGRYTYAHNNYIEILCNLGIVGFATYYSAHIKVISRLKKINKCQSAEFIALLFVVLANDLTVPAYYDLRNILMLSLVLFFVIDQNRHNVTGEGNY